MENKNKKRILIGILLVLILMNLAALSTFGYYKYHNSHRNDKECNKDRNQIKNPHDRVKYFMKKELQLDDNQFSKYCNLKDINIKNSDEIMNHLTKLREASQFEITIEKPDSLKLVQLADSIGICAKKIQLEMNRHFLEVKKILRPNQLIKYNEMILNIDKKQWGDHNNRKNMDSSNNRQNMRRNN
jgi:hypothetical protein